MQIRTTYFEKASKEHTDKVLNLVQEFLSTNPEMHHVVVATTEGSVGVTFASLIKDRNVVVVTHHTGFRQPNYNEIDDDKKKRIEENGATILTTTHAFAGVARGIRNSLGTYSTTEILAYAYRTFGQGTKVCAEIALMAADAGLIPVDEDVICVGGSGRGADTAWIVRPANTNKFTELQMKACLCKPLEF
ncbi:MAG: pyruvate kinase alpha/beta domain-containing protein [Candidatus Thorarchaeota archaeon]|jgi:hypothetical protein